MSLLSLEESRKIMEQSLFTHQADPILIALDLEKVGREIGLAFFDTRDTYDNPPGRDGVNWIRKLHAKHLLTSDCAEEKIAPGHFSIDRSKDFDFGNSELVEFEDLAAVVTQCLRIRETKAPLLIKNRKANTKPQLRDVLLVAHNWANDAKWLKDEIGLDLKTIGTVRGVIDTQLFHEMKLSAMVEVYGGVPHNMHNGANDAVFTMASLIWATLFRKAIINASLDDWSFMEEVCPNWEMHGDKAIEAWKEDIRIQMGGRCEHCKRYGHLIQDCESGWYESRPDPELEELATQDKVQNQWIALAERFEFEIDGRVILRLQGASAMDDLECFKRQIDQTFHNGAKEMDNLAALIDPPDNTATRVLS